MFTPEVTQPKSDYFDHFVANKASQSLISSTFLSPTPSNYSDAGNGFHQSPMSIYNNYNPNYHHHHYYFHPNYQDYGFSHQDNGSVHENGSSWMRKYDYENHKEYFIANTPPTPSECCDFEVPQRIAPSPKPTVTKLFNDLDNIFFDDSNVNKVKDQLNINSNSGSSCDAFSFWDNETSCSEKLPNVCRKRKDKVKCENLVKYESKFGKNTKGREIVSGCCWKIIFIGLAFLWI